MTKQGAETGWTDLHVERLRGMVQARLPVAQIGRNLGKSASNIEAKCADLGLDVGGSGRHSHACDPLKVTDRGGTVAAVLAAAERDREMGGKTCRWPHGSPGEPGFGFCGTVAVGDGPYCQEHEYRRYIPGSSKWIEGLIVWLEKNEKLTDRRLYIDGELIEVI